MKIVNIDEMRRIDREAMETYGIPGAILMENAGRSMAERFLLRFPDAKRGSVFILCGNGNNGGDGCVMARHLHLRGIRVSVGFVPGSRQPSPETRTNLEIIRKLAVPVHTIDESGSVPVLLENHTHAVDALLGTGLKGPVSGLRAELIEILNRSGLPVTSLDVPSGFLIGASSQDGPHVLADLTLTVALPKTGMLASTGGPPVGRLDILPIGFPDALLNDDALLQHWVTRDIAAGMVPSRSRRDHKGTLGRVLLAAGSRDYPGAALLASLGAAAGGAGLVTLAFPSGMDNAGILTRPAVIPRSVPGGGSGCFSPESVKGMDSLLDETVDALVAGPGIGRDPAASAVVGRLLETQLPLVLDADALFHLASILKEKGVPHRNRPFILTPHPGELRRLLDATRNWADTPGALAAQLGAVIIAKDWQTTVHAPDGRRFLITNGHPALARGGTGDVLAGLVGSLLGRGLSGVDSSVLGSWLHAEAGRVLARVNGENGVLPEDLVAAIPRIMDRIRQYTPDPDIPATFPEEDPDHA